MQETIEAYINGTLPPDERRRFEERLENDPALREELRLHRALAKDLSNPRLHALRDVSARVGAEWQAPESGHAPVRRLTAPRWMGLAAGLLFLVLAYFAWPTSAGDGDLFAGHYEPYQMILTERAGSDDAALGDAIAFYQANDPAAAQAFAELARREPDVVAYPFYQAIALLSQGEAAAAVPILENILAKPGHLFTQQSRWYLALAHLRTGDRPAAAGTLRGILPGHYKHKEATDLLKGL